MLRNQEGRSFESEVRMADDRRGSPEDGSGAVEALAWWRALMASHAFRSILAVVLVVVGIVVFAASVR